MKTEIQQETDFKPVEITITCETEKELAVFLSRLNKVMELTDIVGSLFQYGAWQHSPVKSGDITEGDCNRIGNKLERLCAEVGEKVGWKK